MDAQLLTELQARQAAGLTGLGHLSRQLGNIGGRLSGQEMPDPGQPLVVREQRSALAHILLWLMYAVVLIAFTYAFWRGQLIPPPAFPAGFAVAAGFLCLLVAAFMQADLKAVRQPSSWVLVSRAGMLLLKFRSFYHWRWPVEDKVVLRLSPRDVDFIQPLEGLVKIPRGRSVEHKRVQLLEFHLHEPLPEAMRDAVRFENTRMSGKGRMRSRAHHAPVQASADGRVVTLRLGSVNHGFQELQAELARRYQVKPVGSLTSATGVDSGKPALTSDVVRQIQMLAAGGDRIGAINLLRSYTNLSLKESKDAIEQGVESRLAHLIRRPS